MTNTPKPAHESSESLPSVNPEHLEHVTGGGGEVIGVPTEQCPTCASGVDPGVILLQSMLTGDL